jgi:hypothetical protein
VKTLCAALFLVAIPIAAAAAGKQPVWVDGTDPRYPQMGYLTAVGFAPERTAAENSALANVAKIFEAQVASVSKDYMASFNNGKEALEVQNAETLTQVSTKKVLTGVRLAETWDNGKGTMYVLAVLDRDPAAATLRDRITTLDRNIDVAMQKAEGAGDDSVAKIKALRSAAKDMQERMACNADLRIIASDGQGIPAAHSAADIAAMLDSAAGALKIGVKVQGTASSDLSQALTEGLTQAGFQVTPIEVAAEQDMNDLASGAEDMDVVVGATSKMEKATIAGNPVELARVIIDVQLYLPKKHKVLTSFTESKKEGHKSLDEATRRAVRGMKAVLVKRIQETVNKQFGPK